MVAELEALLHERLVAVMLHGSLAMGCYYPPKSDLDVLVVVSDLPDERERKATYDLLARHDATRPYTAGLEVSVIRARDAAHPVHPLPYLAHYGSGTTCLQALVDGSAPLDADLAAHLMVTKQRGLSLYGPSPAELIGPIDWSDYLAAVRYDIDELLSGDAITKSPRYAVLNLCRWLMMDGGRERLVPSKEEAALWAIARLPGQQRAVVELALEAYRSAAPVPEHELLLAGGPWDEAALTRFRGWVRNQLA
jgi:streptomycin 3"-adenylyltransferase